MSESDELQMTGLELSPRKVAYLKFMFRQEEPTVRTSELAESLGVDPSTVTKTLDELSNAGYVDHIPYKGVRLSSFGKDYASFLIRRHQILELVFSKYGLSPEEVCEEVTRLEPFVSKKAIEAICKSMGYPTVSFCPVNPEMKIL